MARPEVAEAIRSAWRASPHLVRPSSLAFQDHGPDLVRHCGTSCQRGPDSVRQPRSPCLIESGPVQVRALLLDQIN